MLISCPNCGFSKEIDDSKLPAGAKRATCPKCKQKFDLNQSVPEPASKPEPRFEKIETEPFESPSAGLEETLPEYDAAYQEAAPPPLPETPPVIQQRFGGPAPAPTLEIPWETREGGFFGDLFKTIKLALFSPPAFFEAMPPTGGYKGPLTFAMVIGTIGMAAAAFYQAAIMFLGAGLSGEIPTDVPVEYMLIGIGGFVLFAPILIMISLFIGAFFMHIFLMIVRGANNGYQATFRVMGYSMATNIFQLIPLIGGIIGFGWTIVLWIIGFPKAHDTGIGRVIVAIIVIPFVLIIGLAIVAAIAIPLLVNATY